MTNEEMALEYYKAGAMQHGNGPWPKPKYIPKTVRLSTIIRGDWPIGQAICAGPGDYPADVNQYGAVSIRADSGDMLGLRLNEFEVVEWRVNPHAC